MNTRRPWRPDLSGPWTALQDELSRIYETVRQGGPIGPTRAEPPEAEPSAWSPAIDLAETPEGFMIWAELPGVDPATIDLTVTGAVLTLRGEKVAPDRDLDPADSPIAERRFGRFFRQVPLPAEVKIDAIEAHAHNGVLWVKLPKIAAVVSRSIPIKPS